MPDRPAGARSLRTRLELADFLYLFAFALTLALLIPRFFHPELVSNDHRAVTFWMSQLHHPELFRGDFITAYARQFVGDGMAAVYWLLTFVMDPIMASKVLGGLTAAGYLLGSRQLGRSLFRDGSVERWVFAAWMAGNGVLIRGVMGGFSRGFGVVLQIAFLALLAAGRPWLALACVVGALFLHPISFVVIGGVFGLWWLWEALRAARSPKVPGVAPVRSIAALGVAGLLLAGGGGAYLMHHSSEMQARFGPMISREDVLSRTPEWQQGGRYHSQQPAGLFADAWSKVTARLASRTENGTVKLLLGTVSLLFSLAVAALLTVGAVRLRGREPALLLGLYALVSLAGYGAAYLLLPRLYTPDRYIEAAAPVLAGALAAVGAASLWDCCSGSTGKNRAARRAVQVFAAAAFVLGLVYTPPTEYGNDLSRELPVARWLRDHSGPAEMFAAFPVNDADNLMTAAERPTLAAHECDWPFHRLYLEETRRRLGILLHGYYAFSRSEALPLARETPARYLVVNRADVTRRLERGNPRTYYRPYRQELRQWLEQHSGQASFWVSPGAPRPVYEDPQYLVFDLKELAEPPAAARAHPSGG